MAPSEIVTNDPRADLLIDIARDPEGHFHRSIGDDRRLPPWFGSGEGSRAPIEIRERVFRFIRDRCTGQVPHEWELRHNWYDRQIEFIRWIPDFMVQDPNGHVALVTWAPLEVRVWPDTQGWLPGGEQLFDYLWRCFITNDPDTREEDRKAREVEDAKQYVSALCSAVSQGAATNEELEEYALQLRIAEPGESEEHYELAKEMIPHLKRIMKDMGI